MKRNAKTSPQQIQSLIRARAIVELRLAGMPYAEIANSLGYNSVGPAYHAVTKALQATPKENIDELRTLQRSRLERMLFLVWNRITESADKINHAAQLDLAAVREARAIIKQLSKLDGLNRREQLDISAALAVYSPRELDPEIINAIKAAEQMLVEPEPDQASRVMDDVYYSVENEA